MSKGTEKRVTARFSYQKIENINKPFDLIVTTEGNSWKLFQNFPPCLLSLAQRRNRIRDWKCNRIFWITRNITGLRIVFYTCKCFPEFKSLVVFSFELHEFPDRRFHMYFHFFRICRTISQRMGRNHQFFARFTRVTNSSSFLNELNQFDMNHFLGQSSLIPWATYCKSIFLSFWTA